MQNAPDTTIPATPPAGPGPERGAVPPPVVKEVGGPPGPEPTRYGDWEKAGRCIDF